MSAAAPKVHIEITAEQRDAFLRTVSVKLCLSNFAPPGTVVFLNTPKMEVLKAEVLSVETDSFSPGMCATTLKLIRNEDTPFNKWQEHIQKSREELACEKFEEDFQRIWSDFKKSLIKR